MPRVGILLVLLAACLLPGDARRIRAGQSGRSILLEVEDALGREKREVMETRMPSLEEALGHTFRALPKNSRGAIGAPAANYALHRLFLQLHGWAMKDLQPQRGAWHEHSPIAALRKRGSPQRLHDVFEERLSKHGLDLHELAVLAAAIEVLVRSEADALLNVSFQAVGIFGQSSNVGKQDALDVMEAYMASYVLGTEQTSNDEKRVLTAGDVRTLSRNIRSYPRWDEVKKLLRASTAELAPEVSHFDFQLMSSILLLTTDKFSKLEEEECQVLKHQLIDMEDRPGSGRVMLSDFYRPTLNQGRVEFSESVDFLRWQGALDETDPESPRVIIPNYMMADSNCLASSEYYAVCCADPCEEIMDQLEATIQAPSAPVVEVLAAVGAIPNVAVLSNRSLDGELKSRLEEVAEHHSGEVPLHGRLFSQWMHHAFPRQCPFPHLSGTMIKQSMTKFQAERHHTAAFAQEQEMRDLVDAHKAPSTGIGNDFNMWIEDEELVDPETYRLNPKPRSKWMVSSWTPVSLLVTFGSAVLTLMKIAPKSSSIYHQKMV